MVKKVYPPVIQQRGYRLLVILDDVHNYFA